MSIFVKTNIFRRFQALGCISCFKAKFHVDCTHSHVWEPPGARVMSIFVKLAFFALVAKFLLANFGSRRVFVSLFWVSQGFCRLILVADFWFSQGFW